MSLMGIDIGTSSCKVLIISDCGNILAQSGAAYTIHTPRRGFFELDPQEVWEKVKAAIQQCNRQVLADPVTALSLSTQGEAVIPVDSEMNPLTFAPVSADLRGLDYVEDLRSHFGEKKIYELTGQQINPIHSIFKVKWWSAEEPSVHVRCWKYCCFDTYVYLQLGMPPVTDRSMAARMMFYNITQNCWSEDLLSYASARVKMFPEVVSSGTVIGSVAKNICRELGFSISPKVIAGGHDQPCAAFGNGMIHSGMSYSIGTTECISVVRKVEDVQPGYTGNPTYPHVFEDAFVTLIGSQTGTRLFSWLGSVIFDKGSHAFSQSMEDFYNLIRKVPSQLKTPVVMLPHLFGGSSYYENTHARALLFGFAQDTEAREFLKSAMEGVTIEQYLGFRKFWQNNLREQGEGPIIATGGGVRFANWLAIKADIFHMPLKLMQSHEAGCLGAAMLAGLGSGVFVSAIDAVNRCRSDAKISHPKEQLHL